MSVLHAEGISKMNPGLFGILGTAATDATSKIKVRNPFTVDNSQKPSIRLGTNNNFPMSTIGSITASLQKRWMAASPNAAVIACFGGTSGAPTATTTIYSSADGITWAARIATSGVYVRVIWSGTKFVAFTNAATAVNTAPSDGVTWSVGTVLNAAFAVGSQVVVFNSKVYIFPPSGTTYYESTTADCTAWTTRVAPANYAAPVIAPTNGNNISVSGSRIIIPTSTTTVITSIDGVTWNTATLSTALTSGNVVTMANSSNAVITDGVFYYNSIDGGSTWNSYPNILAYGEPFLKSDVNLYC